MEFIKRLADNQEYWNMMFNQSQVSAHNYETWFIIQAVVVVIYVLAWILYFTKGQKWEYDTRESFSMVLFIIGLFVGMSTLIALISISDYNMAKNNPELWVLKQIFKQLP
jgi:hypothetical protein